MAIARTPRFRQLQHTSFLSVPITTFLIFIFLAWFAPTTLAQSNTPDGAGSEPTVPEATNHWQLELERVNSIASMYGLMYEITGLFTELERASQQERHRAYLANVNDNLDPKKDAKRIKQNNSQIAAIDKQSNATRNAVIIPALQGSQAQAISLKEIEISEGLRRVLEEKIQQLLKKTDQLSNLGARVNQLSNPEFMQQNFKHDVSWVFAALVGLVIIGFFAVASKDERIRRTIFAGDAGIQFLTMFSIVIAIILFGITKVLEGKEIAALIGGISGYILGRGSNRPDQSAASTDENPNDKPQGSAASSKPVEEGS